MWLAVTRRQRTTDRKLLHRFVDGLRDGEEVEQADELERLLDDTGRSEDRIVDTLASFENADPARKPSAYVLAARLANRSMPPVKVTLPAAFAPGQTARAAG